MMETCAADGVDTCAWIEAQPWSDGQVGMMGTSYVGGTQHVLAMAEGGCPQLKTIIPVDAMSNMGRVSVRNNGAFELRFFNWIFSIGLPTGAQQTKDAGVRGVLTEMSEQRIDYMDTLPLRPGTTPLSLAPQYEDWLVSAMEAGSATDERWEINAIVDYPERYQDIPVYLVGGWYDSWTASTCWNFETLTKQLTSDVYLIMGPWIHGQQQAHSHGQVDFGQAAAIADPVAWRLAWFDSVMQPEKSSAVGVSAPFRTKVRIFVMGGGDGHRTDDGLLYHGGEWRDEVEWPLARAVPTEFFLSAEGGLGRDPPTAAEASTEWEADPANPVPSIGGNTSSGGGILLQGAYDQKGGPHVYNSPEPIPLSNRNDVVCFRSAPLAEDMEVTGTPVAKLFVETDGPDADFTAKLVDVYPPSPDFPGGFDLQIGEAIVRGRFAADRSEETPLVPGQVVELTVGLYPTCNVFKKGHRLRLDIASSCYPRFDLNPNTGEKLNDNRRTRVATNAVHHCAGRPSSLTLPVVPSAGRAAL